MMNDTYMKMESSYEYLAHIISESLDDAKDVKQQVISEYSKPVC